MQVPETELVQVRGSEANPSSHPFLSLPCYTLTSLSPSSSFCPLSQLMQESGAEITYSYLRYVSLKKITLAFLSVVCGGLLEKMSSVTIHKQ